ALRLVDRLDETLAQRIPSAVWRRRPSVDRVFWYPTESRDEAGIEPFLPEAHVGDDVCDRVGETVRLRVCLCVGQPIENPRRLEMHALAHQDARQQIPIVRLVERGHFFCFFELE